MRPKVSIIVPVYKVEKYIDRCLTSLVNQTLRDIEIILVDDESPDSCPRICDNYAKHDNRIRVIHKKNEGAGYARNSGLAEANGEYVAFVDSDDYVSTSMYETMYNIACKRDLDVLFSGFRKEVRKKYYQEIREFDDYIEFSKEQLGELIPDFIAAPPYCKSEYLHDMSVWHSIYKLDIIKRKEIKFVSERIYATEDLPFQIDILKNSTKVAFIPNAFYVYCYNDSSITKTFTFENFDRIKKVYNLLNEKCPEGTLRTDRLFIGFVRFFIRLIISSNYNIKKKITWLKIIIDDPIWGTIKQQYYPKYLPLFNRIFLFLIYQKSIKLLYIYALLFNVVKK